MSSATCEIYETNCNTIVDIKKCRYTWLIENYNTFHCTRYVPLKSSTFSAPNDDFKWHLRHHLHDGFYPKAVDLYLVADCSADVKKYAPISGELRLSTVNFYDGEKRDRITTKEFLIQAEDISYDVYIKEFFWIVPPEIMEDFYSDDSTTIFCELTYVKSNDITNVSTSSPNLWQISESGLSRDFEQIYTDKRFSDVTVFVKEEKYLAHKYILAARSSVFSAMFRNNMMENTSNNIFITDISKETFDEMLLYIYTGKVKNLAESAFELLPAADKYDLKELRIMCEHELSNKLSADNVVQILILALMHHADQLKVQALRFLKSQTHETNMMDKAIWNELCTSHPLLMKDILALFM